MNWLILVPATLQAVTLHAPSMEQTNSYKIREAIASEYGTLVMTGTEKRHIGKPVKGTRQVEITFDVQITERSYSGATAEIWAKQELDGLREPDKGTLDELDRFTEPDGVAVDAFPILTNKPVELGAAWQVMVSGAKCLYTLMKIEKAGGVDCAVINTESSMQGGFGKVTRNGMWKLEIASGRLVSWSIHTNVKYSGGKRETVETSGQLTD